MTGIDFLDDIRRIINEMGFAIIDVFDEDPTFAYTVGLTALGLPELVVADLPAPMAEGFLAEFAARQRAEGEFTGDHIMNTVDGVEHRIGVSPSTRVRGMATTLYGPHRAIELDVYACGCDACTKDLVRTDHEGNVLGPA